MPVSAPTLLIAVGNTRARWGLLRAGELDERGVVPARDAAALVSEISAALADADATRAVIASVNDAAAEPIAKALAQASAAPIAWMGRDLLPPMHHALDDASTLGVDRMLTAFGAWRLAKQACVVIDAGTAITIDFVDGQGAFQGGAIVPGVRMMLASLHAGTSALPELAFEMPDPAAGPFGESTTHAMRLGAVAAARGAVRVCLERYAEAFGAYPHVVGTGGDAAMLFEGDGLVEHIVPDLQLIGIAQTLAALEEEE